MGTVSKTSKGTTLDNYSTCAMPPVLPATLQKIS